MNKQHSDNNNGIPAGAFNWRCWVLAALLIAAVVGVFSEPTEGNNSWLEVLMLTKAIGFGSLILTAYLAKRWGFADRIKDNSDTFD